LVHLAEYRKQFTLGFAAFVPTTSDLQRARLRAFILLR